jgi:Cysteine-rich CPCC
MAGEPQPPEPDPGVRAFEDYVEHLRRHSVTRPARGRPYRCPCCGFLTLDERGTYDICAVCFWEDDGQDDGDAAVVRGGPNGNLSLAQARRNFVAFGANREQDLPHVRAPHPHEHPRPDQD